MAGWRWRRLQEVFWAASLGWSSALAVAALLTACLVPISVDQPLEGPAMLGWGMRWGAVLAVAMASGATLGPAPPARARRIGTVVAFTALLLLGLSLLAAALAILAVRLRLWGQAWDLPSRSGYAARLAALATAQILGLPCAAGGAWLLLRQRRPEAGGHGHG